MSDAERDVALLVADLARALPASSIELMAASLERPAGRFVNLASFGVSREVSSRLRTLDHLLRATPEIDAGAVALALRASAAAVHRVGAEQSVAIAWTGPGTDAVPTRRVDQVIYELVEAAQDEITLVTFVAYKAERVLDSLRDAGRRGVAVKIVLELAEASGGRIAFDGLASVREAVPTARVYSWPLERRRRDPSGSWGSMHAKCLIVDRAKGIVSSANLTRFAMESNMELGLVVEGAVATRLADHFAKLMIRGELVEVE